MNIIFLIKTVGNNERYDFTSQLSIYNSRPDSTACAEFELWKRRLGIVVKRGEKGIPVYKRIGNREKIAYIFMM